MSGTYRSHPVSIICVPPSHALPTAQSQAPCQRAGDVGAEAVGLLLKSIGSESLWAAAFRGLCSGITKEAIPRLGEPYCVLAAGALIGLVALSTFTTQVDSRQN